MLVKQFELFTKMFPVKKKREKNFDRQFIDYFLNRLSEVKLFNFCDEFFCLILRENQMNHFCSSFQ